MNVPALDPRNWNCFSEMTMRQSNAVSAILFGDRHPFSGIALQ
jgi:hypothetical protein